MFENVIMQDSEEIKKKNCTDWCYSDVYVFLYVIKFSNSIKDSMYTCIQVKYFIKFLPCS